MNRIKSPKTEIKAFWGAVRFSFCSEGMPKSSKNMQEQ